jgi:1-deoxy-D-xylulose-5-phosphate synthase
MTMVDQLVADHHTIITLEENSLAGGIGSVIAQHLLNHGCRIDFKALGIADEFVRHGSREELLREQGIDADSIADVIRESIKKKTSDVFDLEQKSFFGRLFAGNIFNGR